MTAVRYTRQQRRAAQRKAAKGIDSAERRQPKSKQTVEMVPQALSIMPPLKLLVDRALRRIRNRAAEKASDRDAGFPNILRRYAARYGV